MRISQIGEYDCLGSASVKHMVDDRLFVCDKQETSKGTCANFVGYFIHLIQSSLTPSHIATGPLCTDFLYVLSLLPKELEPNSPSA